jgi:hypothetical protein
MTARLRLFLRQPQILLVQRLLVLDIIRVFGDAIDGANFYTLGYIIMPDTLCTQSRIDDVNVLALGNRPVRAFRFADIAVDAFIVNYQ